MSDPGVLLAVEGIDGAGKTTQVELLGRALRAAGEEVIIAKEPTDGPWGKRLRQSAATGRLGLEEELDAFVADREEHVRTVIGPALAAGHIVILDRYYYSTIAYQGARGADLAEVRRRNAFAPPPAMVFLIDLDPGESLRRISESRGETPNAFEQLGSLTRIRELFQAMDDANIWMIDGGQAPSIIHATILGLAMEHALRVARCAVPAGCENPRQCDYRRAGSCRWAILADRLPEALSTAPAALRRSPPAGRAD